MNPFAGILARLRSLSRALVRGSAMDAEMTEEMRTHLELRTADLVRSGLAPADAARQARLEFGSVEHYTDRGRESRGLKVFDHIGISWLDVKLGVRMIERYPGLTLMGGAAIAFAVWIGATTFEITSQMLHPRLPIPQGERVVALRLWDAAEGSVERRSAFDFFSWRSTLESVQDLGAFREAGQLVAADGGSPKVPGAEVSASAFRIVSVSPLLGRALTTADEAPNAPPVVVIGEEIWRGTFGGDSAIVGKTARVGGAFATIVGVMPEEFAFPVSHRFWIPLRLIAAEQRPAAGPSLRIFGRLAPGATLTDAQAELTLLGQRAASVNPHTHANLRPQVLPYAESFWNRPTSAYAGTAALNIPPLLLLVLVFSNVALLMFARAATREREIIVRTALGASRRRIVTQLFAEALVLGLVAAVIGLAASGYGVRLLISLVENQVLDSQPLPFWFSERLSPTTLVYAIGLTVLGAIIAGVVPGLRITRQIGDRLKSGSAGSTVRFGGVWTAVIVIQVAVTVAVPILTWQIRKEALEVESVSVGLTEQEYLAATLSLDAEAGRMGDDTTREAQLARFGRAQDDLQRRLISDPTIGGITYAAPLPRMSHSPRLVELDGGGGAPLNPQWPAYRASNASVGSGFFEVVRAEPLKGRTFRPSEYAAGKGAPSAFGGDGGVVVVNESFVRLVLGGRNPIGRRIRYHSFHGDGSGDASKRVGAPWFEIVGVVRDMGMAPNGPRAAGVYHPAATGTAFPIYALVHAKGDLAAATAVIRRAASATDGILTVHEVVRVDQLDDAGVRGMMFWFKLMVVVCAMAVTLSLAGIYAVMSFTVARRTREIGIRTALGGSRPSVIVAVLARPLKQVAVGVLCGAAIIYAIMASGSVGGPSIGQTATVVIYALIMAAVCLLACIVPSRRALEVQPSEALRTE